MTHKIVRDTAVRTIVSMTTRWTVRGALRYVVKTVGTMACHSETIDLLEQWVRWSAGAKTDEVPGRLLLATLKTIQDHKGTVHLFDPLMNQDTAGATAEPSASGRTGADREENTNGD